MTRATTIPLSEGTAITGLLDEPDNARAIYLFAHGAGAGMEHAFLQAVTERLVDCGIAVVRYQFPYMQRRLAEGKRWGRPDPPAKLEATVGAVVTWAAERFSGLPLFAGGKSLGGRMTSRWVSKAEPMPEALAGLVFFGFPLHPSGKPGTERAAHLADVGLPMLFLQGDRDKLADLDLLRPVVEALGPSARLHVAAGADHGFHVLKRSGRTDEEVLDEISTTAVEWMLGAC